MGVVKVFKISENLGEVRNCYYYIGLVRILATPKGFNLDNRANEREKRTLYDVNERSSRG